MMRGGITTTGWTEVTVTVNTTTDTIMIIRYLGRISHTNTIRQEMEGTIMMKEAQVSTTLLTTEIIHRMKTTFIACINTMTRSTRLSLKVKNYIY